MIKLAGQSIANQLWHSALSAAQQIDQTKKQARVKELAEKKLALLEASSDDGEVDEED
jgi:hypothetical protein